MFTVSCQEAKISRRILLKNIMRILSARWRSPTKWGPPISGCENFRGVFDFANFVQVGQDTLEAYELLKEHIAYVHVKDAILGSGRVVPAGYGDGHVGEILQKMI